jgi:Zn-dependent protease with chaperone function
LAALKTQFKNDALVTVSTGLLQGMTKEEAEAVLAHEVAHICFLAFWQAWSSSGFRADAGAGQIMGRNQPMIHALQRLGGLSSGELPKGIVALGITGGLGKLFSTHLPTEERIAALQAKG